MPILKTDFTPTIPFRNGHFNTVYRPFFMKDKVNYLRERVETWDGDFIDLDKSVGTSKTAVLLIHGLEGSSDSVYMKSHTNMLNKHGFDTICMNLRGCSGEDNRLLTTYHSGKTDDVHFIVNYILETNPYEQLIILGFSLGGNLTLKYLGEYAKKLDKRVIGGIAVSVPIDLTTAQAELAKIKNKVYMQEFLKSLRHKILEKAHKHPEYNIDESKLFKATKFRHIEKQYTVPVFGFKSSEDYWEKASCKPYIEKIKIPTLLINAEDDSFLSAECYPTSEAKKMKNFYFMAPKYGGHLGFMSSFNAKENVWLETEVVKFINEHIL